MRTGVFVFWGYPKSTLELRSKLRTEKIWPRHASTVGERDINKPKRSVDGF